MDRCEKGVILLLLTVFGLWPSILGLRIKDGIYSELNERGFCFRRTNGTKQMGCSSDPNGNVGVIHLISTESDKTWLIESGIHEPYIGLLLLKVLFKS